MDNNEADDDDLGVWFTDGVVSLKPLQEKDAAAHVAGGDPAQFKWQDGTARSQADVQQWIRDRRQEWQRGGPAFAFGIWENHLDCIVGVIKANTDCHSVDGISSGEAALQFGLYADYRGRGYAARAIKLTASFLDERGVKRAVIRAHPDNPNAIRVAERCGYTRGPDITTKEGQRLIRYFLDL